MHRSVARPSHHRDTRPRPGTWTRKKRFSSRLLPSRRMLRHTPTLRSPRESLRTGNNISQTSNPADDFVKSRSIRQLTLYRVCRQVTYAAWWWRKNYDAYTNPATRKYFLRSASTGDFCWSNGPIWDFRNASARQYFINNVISEVVLPAHPA